MAAKVRFEVSADVAQAVAALIRVSEAEAGVAAGAKNAAAATRQATRETQTAARERQQAARMSNAATARLPREQQPVFRQGFTVRRQELSTTQMMRSIAAGGMSDSSNAMIQQANVLADARQQRAFTIRQSRKDIRLREILDARAQDIAAQEARQMAQRPVERQGWRVRQAALATTPILRSIAAGGVGNSSNPFVQQANTLAEARRQRANVIRQGRAQEAIARANETELANAKAIAIASGKKRAAFLQDAKNAAGMAAFGVAAYAGKVIENRIALADRVGSEGVDFERQMTGLLSLGDNVKFPQLMKDQVVARSAAMGLDRGQIADTMYNLQSGTANLDGKMQRDLLNSAVVLHKATGTDLNETATAITKMVQVYGKDAGNVPQVSAKIFKTIQDGYLTGNDLATLLPDVLPAGKAMGVSADETLGSIVTATQVGGKTEKTLTGIRNVLLRMNNAEKEGIHLTGTFVEKLEQLSKVDPNTLKKIFGDEAFSVLVTLAGKSAEVKKNIEAIAKVSGSEPMQKVLDRFKNDPAASAGSTIGGLKQTIDNADAVRFKDPELRNEDIRFKAREAGWEIGASATAKTWDVAGLSKKMVVSGLHPSSSEYERLGLGTLYDQYLQAGDPVSRFQANRIRLQFGEQFGTQVRDPKGKQRDATNRPFPLHHGERRKGLHGPDDGHRRERWNARIRPPSGATRVEPRQGGGVRSAAPQTRRCAQRDDDGAETGHRFAQASCRAHTVRRFAQAAGTFDKLQLSASDDYARRVWTDRAEARRAGRPAIATGHAAVDASNRSQRADERLHHEAPDAGRRAERGGGQHEHAGGAAGAAWRQKPRRPHRIGFGHGTPPDHRRRKRLSVHQPARADADARPRNRRDHTAGA